MGVVVIDYGMGNLRSVYNALSCLDANPKIIDSPSDIESADKLVLPGVGALEDAMKGLNERGLIEPLKKVLMSGKIYLGICLGLQILFEYSEEGDVRGFGVLKGKVRRFSSREALKVPHMGWNSVKIRPEKQSLKLVDGIEDGSYFYFDHSYYADPEDGGVVAGTTDYGKDFASFIRRDNIYAVQFHPERSQALGLKLLENFVRL